MKRPMLKWPLVVVVGVIALWMIASRSNKNDVQPSEPVAAIANAGKTPAADIGDALRDILAKNRCPCRCGRFLPESSSEPACFGCSVGKAEITYITRRLAVGATPTEITLELSTPVMIDVFADYTDDGVAAAWDRATRIAEEFRQFRVVLRTPGRSTEAQIAVRVAECARSDDAFLLLQQALIDHSGPWDTESLTRLAEELGLDGENIRACVDGMNVHGQVNKDRQHAALDSVERYPTISVNRALVENTDDALRQAIRKVLSDSSI